MKKCLARTGPLLFSLVFLFISANAQDADVVTIKHKFFTSWFSTSQHIPIVVQYTLTAEMISCNDPIKRTNKFTKDPQAITATNLQKDYTRSGFDRGHNMNAADNACDSTGMKECFYFSNMTPQPHAFNAGVWERLEDQERQEARDSGTIVVFAGSLGKAETIGADKVVVPKYMWKVIYHPGSGTYECYLFPDSADDTKRVGDYMSDLDTIQGDAGIIFNKGAFTWINE